MASVLLVFLVLTSGARHPIILEEQLTLPRRNGVCARDVIKFLNSKLNCH